MEQTKHGWEIQGSLIRVSSVFHPWLDSYYFSVCKYAIKSTNSRRLNVASWPSGITEIFDTARLSMSALHDALVLVEIQHAQELAFILDQAGERLAVLELDRLRLPSRS